MNCYLLLYFLQGCRLQVRPSRLRITFALISAYRVAAFQGSERHFELASQPFDPAAFFPSIDSASALSLRLCATSQLYTRAKATSKVWQLHKSACVSLSVERFRHVSTSAGSAYRNLLSQELHVLLAICQALFRGAELRFEQGFGFGDGICEHDVGLKWCDVSERRLFLRCVWCLVGHGLCGL